MKKILALLALLAPTMAFGATAIPGQSGFYSFGTGTAVGPVGTALYYGHTFVPPSVYEVDWNWLTAAPTACTFQGEGSSDGTHWYGVTGTLDCTTNNIKFVAGSPVLYFRVNILTYTAGSSTGVQIRYGRGI